MVLHYSTWVLGMRVAVDVEAEAKKEGEKKFSTLERGC